MELTVLSMQGLDICLIILNVWQAFEDALGSKCASVLNMVWLHIHRKI